MAERVIRRYDTGHKGLLCGLCSSETCTWLCVRHYLHSDCALFGHGLVHPNEGHIVVKVIDRALKRKSQSERSITHQKAKLNKN